MHFLPAEAWTGSSLIGVMFLMAKTSWLFTSSARTRDIVFLSKMLAADRRHSFWKNARSRIRMERLMGGAIIVMVAMASDFYVFFS